MSCNCNKPKCDGKCGISPSVLQINNPGDCTLFHRVEVPASMGDSKTNPPKNGDYRNVLLYYVADGTSWLFSSDGIPQKLVNGFTNYADAVNLPIINNVTLIGSKTGTDLGLQDKLIAGDNIQIATDGKTISATDTTYGPATDNTIGLVRPGDGLEVASDGAMNISDIEQYAHFFDAVADMKAADLSAGDYIRTGGYYSVNDGGSALYKIRAKDVSETADEMFIIALHDDTIVAELVLIDCLCAEQLGAYGDGTHDDTTALQAGIDYCITNNLVFKSKGDKTYLISSSLTVDNCNIDFNNAVIKSATAIDLLTINSENYYGELQNITLDLNSIATCGIRVTEGRKKDIHNIIMNNVTTVGFYFDSGYEINFHDSHINGNANSTTAVGVELHSGDSNFADIILIDCNTAIKSYTVANILTRIHAWVLNTAVLTDSKFINCAESSVLFVQDCCSDTYQYTFYQTSGAEPQIMCNGLNVFFNNNVYNHNTYNHDAYLIYQTSATSTRFITITDSYIKGMSDANLHLYLCNETTFYGNLCNNTYFSVTNNIANALTSIHADLTTVKNEIRKNGDMITIDALFSYDASTLNGAVNIGNLPANQFKPKTAINNACIITEKQWNSDEYDMAYLYIEDGLSARLPANLSGTRYIHIHITYPNKVS